MQLSLCAWPTWKLVRPPAFPSLILLFSLFILHPVLVRAQEQRPANPGNLSVSPAAERSATITDPAQGISATQLVRRALSSNAELAAARLEIERARARLRQTGLRPNPTIDFEQSSGRLVNNPGERATIIGFSLPLEVTGQRARRLALAQAELEAAQAAVAEHERLLAAEVRKTFVEALSAQRELDITEGLNRLDTQTVRVVEARVTEGDAAPLEASLLRVEIDRLRSRRALVEGRFQVALLRLKTLAGIPLEETLQIREELARTALSALTITLNEAVETALRTRPDLRLARLMEEAARAGLRLAEAQAGPSVTINARYTFDRTLTSLPAPLTPFPDTGRSLSFGVSIGLPVFNRNQGNKAEAAVAITQAQQRREFIEAVIRAEVASAFTRQQAAANALATFEQGVIGRSQDNIRAIRGAYEVGAFSVTELLAEQRRLLDLQKEFTEALAERWRANADLQSAMGIIEEK